MLEAMIAAAPSSSNILKQLLVSQKDEHTQQQTQEQDVRREKGKEVEQTSQQQQVSNELYEDLDKEGYLYLLGHKRVNASNSFKLLCYLYFYNTVQWHRTL